MELLGLIDTLEAMIAKGNKIPLTDKVVIEEKRILALIDKLRFAVKQGEGVIRKTVEREMEIKRRREPVVIGDPSSEAQKVLNDAYNEAKKIRESADEYADQVLANLQIIIAKMQRSSKKMDEVLENGRNRLKKSKELDEKTFIKPDNNLERTPAGRGTATL
jgi:hypothetical protein